MCRKRSEFGYNKEKGGQHPNLNKSKKNKQIKLNQNEKALLKIVSVAAGLGP